MVLLIVKVEWSFSSAVTERTPRVLLRKPSPTVRYDVFSHITQFKACSARDNNFDVVLIDTAGRMQDNEVCLQGSLAANAEMRFICSPSCVL